MRTEFEREEFAQLLPDGLAMAETALSIAAISDRVDLLSGEEKAELSPMAPKRQAGFSSGRYCAARAQSLLKRDPEPILREERTPIWPQGLWGSITHTEHIAAAMVSSVRSVGIDLEELDRMHEGLHKTLFTENELVALANYSVGADTIMFSAKEAGYKAIYPVGKKFIGFHEAEIELDESSQTFKIRYVGDHEPNKALNSGEGRWAIALDHVFTFFQLG